MNRIQTWIFGRTSGSGQGTVCAAPLHSRLRRGASLVAGLWLLSAVLLLGACTKESMDVAEGPAQDGRIAITLVPEPMGEAKMNTRAQNVDENLIKDLWVIQLNSEGTMRLQPPQYITNLSGLGNSWTANVYLKEENSLVYFLANTHNDQLCTNYNSLENINNMQWYVGSEDVLAAQGLPMIGHFEGTPSEAALQNVSLSHTVAKMTLRIASGLPAGQSFTLTSVTVNNVPQVLKMVPHNPIVPTSIWEVYPGPLAPMNATYADLPLSDKTVGSATTTLGTVYMPENCMGGGTATDQRNKTAATAWNGWDQGGENYPYRWNCGDKATYIDIKGTIKNENTNVPVQYRVFLGRNAIDDYNVVRGRHYVVTVLVNGGSDIDKRVSIMLDVDELIEDVNLHDYTDNGTGLFLFTLNPEKTAISESYLAKLDAQGVRLPTKAEMELIYGMSWVHPELNKDDAGWWAWEPSDKLSGWSVGLWYMDKRGKWSNGMNPATACNVVKVMDNFMVAHDKKYPYVDPANKSVIVNREGGSGMSTRYIHEKYNSNTGNRRYTDNLVAAKFEVYNSTTVKHIFNCSALGNGWRSPTIAELRTIVSLKGELDANCLINTMDKTFIRTFNAPPNVPPTWGSWAIGAWNGFGPYDEVGDPTQFRAYSTVYMRASDGDMSPEVFSDSFPQLTTWSGNQYSCNYGVGIIQRYGQAAVDYYWSKYRNDLTTINPSQWTEICVRDVD